VLAAIALIGVGGAGGGFVAGVPLAEAAADADADGLGGRADDDGGASVGAVCGPAAPCPTGLGPHATTTAPKSRVEVPSCLSRE
jgi:hypothetical protein